jgi:hypothetical protein
MRSCAVITSQSCGFAVITHLLSESSHSQVPFLSVVFDSYLVTLFIFHVFFYSHISITHLLSESSHSQVDYVIIKASFI